MNHQEQFEYRQQLQQYIMQSNVNQILESMLEELIINKPKNPIDFIIQKLEEPESNFVNYIMCVLGQINFVIGPPGLKTFTYVEKVREEKTTNKYHVFNCGQYVSEISSKLSVDSQNKIKDGLLSNKAQIDDKILSKIKQIYNGSKNSIIIEGYPKTLEQAIALQKAKIPPTKMILMNVSQEYLHQICKQKLESIQPSLQGEEQQDKVDKMKMEYRISLRQLKKFYNNFAEIDLTKGANNEQYITQELKRAFDLKTISVTPRTCSHVLIIGAPHSGRTTLAKSFACFYNVVYISTRSLISNQIRKDSIAGRKIKDAFIKNQLIDEFTIQKLIQERIAQTDCRMQGFVLEGYPKTKEQYQHMKNLNIRPTLTVVIDMPEQESLKRASDNKIDSSKKRYSKWLNFKDYLKEQSAQKKFWVDFNLNEQNMFQEVKYEFEKKI